ncbi:hypothetical protein ACFWTE_03225 [Nocardiopsis sp. NPDC058631]|uniref:hypothetical protein n=1 Tax=Nocardiopsis sp. NPDC058631 TaxID=3346566 RepID=UPI0036651EBE
MAGPSTPQEDTMRFFVPMTLAMGAIFTFEVAFSTMSSHDVVLSRGLGELGYVGAAAVFASPVLVLLVLLLVQALHPASKSRDAWLALPLPALYPLLCLGFGADLTRLPDNSDDVGLLILPLAILLPLVGALFLVYILAREKIRKRAGLSPENPVVQS